jgi:hypothetical protein
VSYRGSQGTIYVVNSAAEIENRTVKLGMRTPTEVEVESGVQEGEQVVVSDRSSLKAGQRVQPTVVENVESPGQTQQ